MPCQCRVQLSQLQGILSSLDSFIELHNYQPFALIDSFAQGYDESEDLFRMQNIKGLKYLEDCVRTDVRMLQLVRLIFLHHLLVINCGADIQ